MTTPTITDYPGDIPAKGQSNTVFDTNVDAYLVWLSTLNIPELKILTPWISGIRDEVAATAMSGTLPSIAGKATNFVRVNAGETAMEFRTPAQVLIDIGANTGPTSSALTPAATVDIDLTDDDYFTLAMDQNTTFTMSNVGAGVDTFSLKLTGHAVTTSLYDLDAAYYTNKTIDLFPVDTTPTGLTFKPDGTAMYVMGDQSNTVYQYELSTAWALATASYINKKFDVGTQAIIPTSVRIKPDGTAMYVSDSTTDTVYQYTLSTAWDVSTASYASKSVSVAGQATDPEGLVFKPDGTAMYITCKTTDTVYQYTLSTAWDVSTASYASKSVSVVSETSSPEETEFSLDGTSMYVLGSSLDGVYQYDLSTAWDVSTASYASKSIIVRGRVPAPTGFAFSSDGTQMYICGSTNDAAYQYSVDGSVYATTTYPAAFKFPTGFAPDAPKDDVVNMLDFVTTDGGTTWYGTQIGEDYK